jgi:hypothetical protein
VLARELRSFEHPTRRILQMNKGVLTALVSLGLVTTVALGFAVAGLASSDGANGTFASTSESTTEDQSPTVHKATLSARAEVPKPTGVKIGAGGAFTLSVAKTNGKFVATFKLSFRNLTGKALAAHIHKGKPGTSGAVLVPLCGPCKNGATGKRTLSVATHTAIGAGQAYINVHTAKNPAGEIRGQVK